MQAPIDPVRLPVVGPDSITRLDHPRFIHLLYAPTNFCNLGCKYCYLGDGTDAPLPTRSPLLTLKSAIETLLAANIVPFNISLHGGEPSAIRPEHLDELFDFIGKYYKEHGDLFVENGLPRQPLHIKTNLFNFDRLYNIFDRHQVSISASVDLPLSLHGKYRTDKKGRSTLDKTLANLRLLSSYPHHKKTSCVISKEHLAFTKEIADDIRLLHHEYGLNMTKFNVMFGFESEKNEEKFGAPEVELEMLNQDEQVEFYQAMKNEFAGTDLDEGLRTHWFKEFTPDFCCSAVNCGDKFFLLQESGDVYSCPRGQSSTRFRYGNIFKDGVQAVFENGARTIEAVENELEIHSECRSCEYLPYCNVGCTFVRDEGNSPKSYTCKLQKELYRDAPEKYPPFPPEDIRVHLKNLLFRNNYKSVSDDQISKNVIMNEPSELHEEKNALSTLIEGDPALKDVYSNELFAVSLDGKRRALESQILSTESTIELLKPDSQLLLHVKKDAFERCTEDATNNFLHLMLLRNTLVVYGDEQRTKQQHIADLSLYSGAFADASEDSGDEYIFNLGEFLRQQKLHFLPDVRNNLFVTTKALRETHYRKQTKNAFYHIQAINLPFQNFEFYWKE